MSLPPRRGRIALPSLGAGVLLALSLPPWGWWPLGLVGAALLYWRLAGLAAAHPGLVGLARRTGLLSPSG